MREYIKRVMCPESNYLSMERNHFSVEKTKKTIVMRAP